MVLNLSPTPRLPAPLPWVPSAGQPPGGGGSTDPAALPPNPTTAGVGHGQERHEPAPARVHGDVQHEAGPGRADGDLPPAHQRLRRQVPGPVLPGDAMVVTWVGGAGGEGVCGAAAYSLAISFAQPLCPSVRPPVHGSSDYWPLTVCGCLPHLSSCDSHHDPAPIDATATVQGLLCARPRGHSDDQNRHSPCPPGAHAPLPAESVGGGSELGSSVSIGSNFPFFSKATWVCPQETDMYLASFMCRGTSK